MASASGSVCARITGIMAPWLMALDDVHGSLPFAILICILLVDLVLFVSFIPETKQRHMVEHMPPDSEFYFDFMRRKADTQPAIE